MGSLMSDNTKHAVVRQQIAREAARIMSNQGHHDYRSACRKAAGRLGIRNARCYPKNADIEQALKEYQRLFHGERQSSALYRLRQLAVEAMQSLHRFRPRLVGPVLQGTADSHSGIKLHLFAETAEEVALTLSDMQIPWRQLEHTLRYRRGETRRYPIFSFHAGDIAVELVVFPPTGLRDAPLSPLDDQPEQRASLKQARALLEHPPSFPMNQPQRSQRD
jgi:hypothetical protein